MLGVEGDDDLARIQSPTLRTLYMQWRGVRASTIASLTELQPYVWGLGSRFRFGRMLGATVQ